MPHAGLPQDLQVQSLLVGVELLLVCHIGKWLIIQLLLPQRLVFPSAGEAHHGGLNGRIFRQKRFEILNEGVPWIDAVEPVGNAAEAWI